MANFAEGLSGVAIAQFELSANIEWLFTEAGTEWADRLSACRASGIREVEIWNWRDKDIPRLHEALRATEVRLRTMCVEPMGQLTDPATHPAFWGAVYDSRGVAEFLGCPYMVVTAGDSLSENSETDQVAAVVEALAGAADILSGGTVTLLLENLNSRVDHAGTFVDTTEKAVRILTEVDSSYVGLLYDAYHAFVMEENPATDLDGCIDLVRHVQIADAPGRAEPGTGNVAWRYFLDDLGSLGYHGLIGLEYQPSTATADSLSLIQQLTGAARTNAGARSATDF